jgi:transposase-like protein
MIEFKGSHFEREVILWGVRWYVAYPISYRRFRRKYSEEPRSGCDEEMAHAASE